MEIFLETKELIQKDAVLFDTRTRSALDLQVVSVANFETENFWVRSELLDLKLLDCTTIVRLTAAFVINASIAIRPCCPALFLPTITACNRCLLR